MANPLASVQARQASALAADARSLDALKRDAGKDPQAAVRKAAQQFEALFMQMVLKSMREATPKSGLFESAAGDMFTGMLDQQISEKVASGGTGLAEVITRQLMRQIAPADPSFADARPIDPTSPARPRIAARDAAAAASAAATGPAAGSKAGSAGGAAADIGSSQRDFVAQLLPHARAAEQSTGLPAHFMIGQAALESGWGQREIRGSDGSNSHNLFGIKAGAGWQGRTVDALTTEYINGVPVKRSEKFRAYDSYADAFRDWSQLIGSSRRYAPVMSAGNDAAEFAYGLQRAGYATDPNYGAKLLRTIHAARALGGAV